MGKTYKKSVKNKKKWGNRTKKREKRNKNEKKIKLTT
jgi:hypothetical protein